MNKSSRRPTFAGTSKSARVMLDKGVLIRIVRGFAAQMPIDRKS
jgi:hypothetical protein